MIEITVYKKGTANAALERIRSRSIQMNNALVTRVAEIVDGVRSGGDEALIHYTEKFDGVTLKVEDLRVRTETIRDVAARADAVTADAFRQAIRNIRSFHERQKESSWLAAAESGAQVGQRILPLASAGLYVPGGLAAYPSSLAMNAVPAQVAGVPRIAVVTPPRTIERAPAVAAVLVELGLEEVYCVGGAQAIAALAFGTETIRPVDKIVGPGNAYVAIAKKLVYGTVGIDSIAGPTEVVILADESAEPKFVAADLLAQAEHAEDASAICVTTSQSLAREVAREVGQQLAELKRGEIAGKSIERYGAIFVTGSLEEACDLVNHLAPEHLELMTTDDDAAAALIENAGAMFFGPWSSEPVGDYLAGPNHVLPTLRTARFSSPLGVYDFVKRQSIIRYTEEAIRKNASLIASMADAEGLTAHKHAVLIRERLAKNSLPSAATAEAPLDRIKPAVRAITAYTLPPYRARIKINQNENPFDMPAEIKAEIESRLAEREWSRYPDFVPTRLLERLAAFSGWRPDGVLAGNGSNELIQATLMVIVRPGSRVVIPEPTFTLYRQVVTVLGGEVLNVPLTRDLRFDVAALEERAARADLMILCSPNNPTGCVIGDTDLIRLARSFTGILVVDEAYHEFSRHTVVPLLQELPNLIVLRTFSKAMSMAGLRVGYLLGSPELTREVHKATLPYNLNFFSATAAEVACERFELLLPRINKIVSERERLFAALRLLPGCEPVPSSANFMIVRTPLPPRDVFEKLHSKDILVRDVSRYPMLAEYFRVSVGSADENDRLVSALGEILGERDTAQ